MYVGYATKALVFFGVWAMSAVVSGFDVVSLNIRMLIQHPSETLYVLLAAGLAAILYFTGLPY